MLRIWTSYVRQSASLFMSSGFAQVWWFFTGLVVALLDLIDPRDFEVYTENDWGVSKIHFQVESMFVQVFTVTLSLLLRPFSKNAIHILPNAVESRSRSSLPMKGLETFKENITTYWGGIRRFSEIWLKDGKEGTRSRRSGWCERFVWWIRRSAELGSCKKSLQCMYRWFYAMVFSHR